MPKAKASAKNNQEPILQGLRVVEIGQRIAAPLVGMLLAEQGAQVLRIIDRSQPDRDPILSAILSRGKIETNLDLQCGDGRDRLMRLISLADVVIDGCPQGTMQQIGIDFDKIRTGSNPGLISCSIDPFPPDDPRANLPDYEGIAGMAGFLYAKPIGKPQYHDFPIGSVMAGFWAANAIVAALIARVKIGRGQNIETSLFRSNIFAQILQVLIKTGVPRGFLPMKMIGTPFMSPWLCKDKRYIYLHITLPLHAAQIMDMLEELGYKSEIAELRGIISEETLRDPSQVKSIPEAKQIRKAYEKIFITKSADEWEKLLGERLCCIKVRTIDEWLIDSYESGMTDVCKLTDPVFGEAMYPGAAAISPQRPPCLKPRIIDDQAVNKILAEWESAPGNMNTAQKEKASLQHALQGIKVLDLSRVIAGPCAARVLAEFGAEVTMVQNPTSLDWALSFHLVFNPGKRSASLNFTTEEGQKKLWKLIEKYHPDVLIQNYRHLDIAKRFGIHPDKVRASFPDMVYTHLNAYGNEGGWKDRPGFEQVVQAVSGIQMSYGKHGRPKLLPTPVIDIGSGLAGAYSTMLGLYHRELTGKGIFSATHLTTISVYLQVNRVADYQREKLLNEAKNKGVSVSFDPDAQIMEGIIRALDAFVCIAGPRRDMLKWMLSAKLINRLDLNNEQLWTQAAKRFIRKPLIFWKSSLIDAGVQCSIFMMPATSIRNLTKEILKYDKRTIPMVRRRKFPGVASELTFVSNPVTMSLTPMKDVSPPPIRGGNTWEVMKIIGEEVPKEQGVIPYHSNKPFFVWLSNLIRWAYFAWRSGNI